MIYCNYFSVILVSKVCTFCIQLRYGSHSPHSQPRTVRIVQVSGGTGHWYLPVSIFSWWHPILIYTIHTHGCISGLEYYRYSQLMMSSCYKTLDVMGKERYKEKLKPVCFSISNKPYLPSHTKKFCSDISQWPKIKYGHIFAYFISRPGTYTQEQLLLGSSGNVDNLPVFPGYHQELI